MSRAASLERLLLNTKVSNLLYLSDRLQIGKKDLTYIMDTVRTAVMQKVRICRRMLVYVYYMAVR